MATEASTLLQNKLSFPDGYAENIWWILGVTDGQIQYLFKMNRSISPNLKTIICGDSDKLFLEIAPAIPDQPALFNVVFLSEKEWGL